jgi:Uma2 family endonuclease
MSADPKRITIDEFLAFAEGREGRYELVRGQIVAQSSERAAHWKTKFALQVALLNAVKAKALPSHVVPDGATVRIDETTAYEPDALLYCGPEVSDDSLLVENPLVIVEVLSPSTGRTDKGRKLADYFRLPSVAHYLIVDCERPLVIHHRRGEGGDIVTRIAQEETIALDPPGVELRMAEIYAAG